MPELRKLEVESNHKIDIVDVQTESYSYILCNIVVLQEFHFFHCVLTPSLFLFPGFGLCEYEVLHVLPFDSNRKRMSIIVRHPQTLQKILYCKGKLVCKHSSVKFALSLLYL